MSVKIDLEALRRVANNVRAAYYGKDCLEAQYIDLAANEITQLRKTNKEMYEACLSALGALSTVEKTNMVNASVENLKQVLSKTDGGRG